MESNNKYGTDSGKKSMNACVCGTTFTRWKFGYSSPFFEFLASELKSRWNETKMYGAYKFAYFNSFFFANLCLLQEQKQKKSTLLYQTEAVCYADVMMKVGKQSIFLHKYV